MVNDNIVIETLTYRDDQRPFGKPSFDSKGTDHLFMCLMRNIYV